MSYSFNLLSHKNKLLINHLRNVGEISKNFIENLNLYIENKEVLCKVIYLIGISHDFGKATTFFQAKVNEEVNKSTEKADHSYLSSLFTFWLIDKFLQRNSYSKFSYLSLFSWLVVARHHNDLKSFSDVFENIKNFNALEKQIEDIKKNNKEELSKIYTILLEGYNLEINLDEFLNNIQEVLKILRRKIREFRRIFKTYERLDKYFEFTLSYSALIDADKIDASCENNKEFEKLKNILFERQKMESNLVDEYKKCSLKKEKKIDNLREQAYNEVISKLNEIDLKKNKIFSIELPTGMGKTLTSFSFALKLREKIKKDSGYKPRIIYCLPFLSTIDQNSKVISEVLSMGKKVEEIPTNLFLKHHHLSDIKYVKKNKEDLEEYEKDQAFLLMEGWYSEVIITTFVQFFESLISVKNRSIRKVHNITNSIIILDEFQAVPCEYWKLTKEVIKFLAEKWNCYIIIMTATMPMIFERKEIFPLVNNPEKYFGNENLNRYLLYVDTKEKIIEKFFEEIIKKIEKGKENILVVLNTIKSSQELYKRIREKYSSNKNYTITEEGIVDFGDFYLVNLNSTIIPLHRLKRIEKIRKESKRKIIISTQLIEAGVDIDVDIVYRDFAPIDAIVQSAGRCNRNGKNMGKVFLIRLIDKQKKLYSLRIYGIVFKDITEKILNRVRLEEKEIRRYINEHFVEVEKRRDILKYYSSVCELKFSNGKEPISDFSLIKEEFGKEDFCICFDNALEIISKIKKLKEKRRKVQYEEKFKISAEIKDLRKKLENFVISPWIIGKENLIPYGQDKDLWGIRVIENPEEAKNIYNIEIGFISNSSENFEDRFL